jgi:adenylate kinase
MKNIIIFGPPGTGKGTMSEKLAEEFGFRHISTGDIIRKNQEDKTKIGVLADRMVNAGKLLPNKIVNEMMKQEIIDDKTSKGFIFDGYPRTVSQAKMLDQLLNYNKTPVTKVIYLDSPKITVLNRIIERGKTSGRKDDNIEAFQIRWQAYQSQTAPALSYFEGRGVVERVNGEQTIDEVYSEVKKIIDGLN